jgi:hypothetical protein
VKYDPVRRAAAFAVPNDPFYSRQWGLRSPIAGINAETAWTLQPSTHGRGRGGRHRHPPHPDLEGRVLRAALRCRSRDGDATT